MTLSSPQLHPAVAPLAICVVDGGRSFRIVLPEPADAELFAEILAETRCREFRWNREWFEWAGLSRHPNAIDYLYRVIEDLQDVWQEIHVIEEPEPPPMLALPPAPPEVGKGTRGLIDMAREMQLDAGELESRLESGAWNYIVTKRVSADGFNHRESEGYKGVWTRRHEYFFNMPDAKHNVANVEVAGKVKIRKDVEQGE